MIKIKNSKDGKIYYTVQGKNNEILVTSETLETVASALKSINALKNIFSNDDFIIKDETGR